MEKSYVNGIGIASILGNSIDEFWVNINNNSEFNENKIDKIPRLLEAKLYRRLDKFSSLGLNSVFQAGEDSKITFLDKERVGTIFNTTYGPGITNMKFAEYVSNGEPDLASPTVFTNTVNNACLGYICMYFGFKGVSTMFLCSNSIGYSMRLLENNKATHIFAGGIEEYNEGIFNGFSDEGYKLKESAVALLLSNYKGENCYSRLLSYHEENLLAHPYIEKGVSINSQDIENIMNRAIEKGQISKSEVDIVITTMDNLKISDTELGAINNLFKGNAERLSFKEIFGDFLGASSHFGIMLASLIIKKQEIPKIFNLEESKKIGTILVNNYDKSGSFTSYVVKAVD